MDKVIGTLVIVLLGLMIAQTAYNLLSDFRVAASIPPRENLD